MKTYTTLLIFLLFVFSAAAWGADTGNSMDASDEPEYWQPKSTFEPSTDVSYEKKPENAETIQYTNVTVDNTLGNKKFSPALQERTQFQSTNTITVLNNMGSSSGDVYSADKLESWTGEPAEKKGVVQVPYGDSAHFTTTGTQIISKASPENTPSAPSPSPSSSAKFEKPRVLVS